MTFTMENFYGAASYYGPTEKPISSEMKIIAEQMFAWKKARQQLEPEDVLNFLIETNLVTEKQIKDNFVDSKKTMRLPKKFI